MAELPAPGEGQVPVDLPRPALPPRFAERVVSMAEARGLALGPLVIGGLAVVVAGMVGWWLLRPPSPPVEASLPVEAASAPASASDGSAEAGGSDVPAGGAGPTSGAAELSTTSTGPVRLVVHVAGAVVHPGLVEVPGPARVDDAVEAAGGLSTDADVDRLNLAAAVADGERVYVPAAGQVEVPVVVEGAGPKVGSGGEPGAGDAGGGAPPGPVDLDRASADELDSLPGVGPATAAAIIAYRDQHGGFGSVDELLEVRGIGEAKLAELQGLVTA